MTHRSAVDSCPNFTGGEEPRIGVIVGAKNVERGVRHTVLASSLRCNLVTISEPRVPKDHRAWLYGLALLIVIAGVVVLVGSIPATAGLPVATDWPTSLAPAGATLTVGGLAGVVALSASLSWRKQRQREEIAEASKRQKDRDFESWKIRAAHYDTLAVSVVQQFVGSFDAQAMAADRARAVLWGSAGVVRALEQWDIQASTAYRVQTETGQESLNDTQKGELWTALAGLMRAMREELPGDLNEVLPNKSVLRTVFADFRQLDDMGKLPSSVRAAVTE